MAQVIHGTIPYAFYDVPVLLGSEPGYANGEFGIAYIVTRDPSSGGDFVDWEFERPATIFTYDEAGDRVQLNPVDEAIVKEMVLAQLDDQDINERCIEDALNFS